MGGFFVRVCFLFLFLTAAAAAAAGAALVFIFPFVSPSLCLYTEREDPNTGTACYFTLHSILRYLQQQHPHTKNGRHDFLPILLP